MEVIVIETKWSNPSMVCAFHSQLDPNNHGPWEFHDHSGPANNRR